MKDILEDRNDYIHGNTPEERTALRRKKILPKVRYYYKHKECLVTQFNQKLFRMSLREREQKSPERLERWLEMVNAKKKSKAK